MPQVKLEQGGGMMNHIKLEAGNGGGGGMIPVGGGSAGMPGSGSLPAKAQPAMLPQQAQQAAQQQQQHLAQGGYMAGGYGNMMLPQSNGYGEGWAVQCGFLVCTTSQSCPYADDCRA
jgi:hypothetical protein